MKIPEPDRKPIIPRLLSASEVQLLYGINETDLKILLRSGRLMSIKASATNNRRVIYDPAWSLSFGGSGVNEEHAHVFSARDVGVIMGCTPQVVGWYAEQRIIGYKIVGKRKFFSLLNIREAIAWRERKEKHPTQKAVRQWMIEWARKALSEAPKHPLKPRTKLAREEYPMVRFPIATLPKKKKREVEFID